MNTWDSNKTNRANLRLTLEEWIKDYGGQVYKVCRSLAFSREDADELFQETYLKALEQLQKRTMPTNPQGFLFTTSVFIWKEWKRKYARRNRIVLIEQMDETIADNTSVEESVLKQEEIRITRELVDTLPDKFKTPIILYYTLEMTIPEIASTLNIPDGTVKSRLHKARKLIGKGLVQNGHC